MSKFGRVRSTEAHLIKNISEVDIAKRRTTNSIIQKASNLEFSEIEKKVLASMSKEDLKEYGLILEESPEIDLSHTPAEYYIIGEVTDLETTKKMMEVGTSDRLRYLSSPAYSGRINRNQEDTVQLKKIRNRTGVKEIAVKVDLNNCIFTEDHPKE